MSSDLYHLRQPAPPQPEALAAAEVMIESDDPTLAARLDPKTGALEIEQADGGVVIDFSGGRGLGPKDKKGAAVHGANLAEYLDEMQLTAVSGHLVEGIQRDDQSRREWLDQRQDAIKLLAIKVEPPRSDAGNVDAPVEGQSVVRSPVMIEALTKFQANAAAEMLPSSGPVKVRNDAPPKTTEEKLAEAMAGIAPVKAEKDIQAERLEIEFNHFFTVTAREYYPDTRRLLFTTGMGGSGFKKVYYCPLRRRPVSESVDAKDIIVDNAQVDLHNAGRVTHQIIMRRSVMKRMQLAKAYRDIDLGQPAPPIPDPQENAQAEVQGIAQTAQLPDDTPFTIWETYCELDLPGFEHKEDGEITGLPLPYKVTLDKDSGKILEIRRNWKEGDERFIAKMPIVKYPFIEGMGLYGLGLYHLLGNATAAVTAAWRMALDAGMFASFPGFLYSTTIGRQKSNIFRIPPGAGVGVDTNGMPIGQAVMAVPYKDATPGLLAIMQDIKGDAQRLGATADMPVGEGRQNAPVGTTLALIEQATQVMGGVHKGLHAAQAEEFGLIKELLAEYPDCLICAKNPKRQQEWEREALVKALNDCDLVPAADPNTPSHMHRIMKAVALMQVNGMFPGLFDPKELSQRVLTMLAIGDTDSLYAPPQPQAAPQPTPDKALDAETRLKVAGIQAERQRLSDQVKLMIAGINAEQNEKDRLADQMIELLRIENERLDLAQSALIHPEGIAQLPGLMRMFPQQQLPQPAAPPQRVI